MHICYRNTLHWVGVRESQQARLGALLDLGHLGHDLVVVQSAVNHQLPFGAAHNLVLLNNRHRAHDALLRHLDKVALLLHLGVQQQGPTALGAGSPKLPLQRSTSRNASQCRRRCTPSCEVFLHKQCATVKQCHCESYGATLSSREESTSPETSLRCVADEPFRITVALTERRNCVHHKRVNEVLITQHLLLAEYPTARNSCGPMNTLLVLGAHRSEGHCQVHIAGQRSYPLQEIHHLAQLNTTAHIWCLVRMLGRMQMKQTNVS